ncbi:MAG: hypothetical protein K5945_05925, partial [Bacteroidaceae bacterium]|nr:hypothetical protein [Bacteroidaceae bacterium]
MKQHFTLFLAALMSMAGMNAWALEANGEGVYEIGSAQNLVDFSAMVNSVSNNLKAVLTTDIDMGGIDNFTPIGTEATPFTGTFDGQGHKLSHLTVNTNTYAGLFGYVSGGATVKNLILDSTCEINATNGGYAGIIGGSNGSGLITMSKLGNEGTVTAAGPNAGGIIGVNMNSTATFIIENCYVSGSVTGANESGAITGWTGGAATITNCWSSATITGNDEGLPFFRPAGTAKNCYNLTGEQANKMTMEQLKSGEICYKLNGGEAENVAWYQTVDVDEHPVLDPTHGKVYWSGDINCDGKVIMSSGSFTNTYNNPTIPPHEFNNGVCKNCGMIDPNAEPLRPNADGIYEIASVTHLIQFGELVNAGNYTIKGILTADLDMSVVENFMPIAPSTENSTSFRGTFDGQGHTISNLNIHTDANYECYVGLFSCMTGALVENVFMKNVTITTESLTPVATGPLVGRNSSSVINNVGVIGVTLNLAAIGEKSTGYGGVIGYASSNVKSFMSYCFTDFEKWGNFGSKATITNCYGGNEVAEMAPTGELCYKLNEGQLSTVWYQTLGEDEYPVFDSTHKQVYGVGKMTCDGTLLEGTLTYSNDPDASGRAPHDYDHGICKNCGFCNVEYKELVDNAYELDDAKDIIWFSTVVNNGLRTANARLTDDIDMAEVNSEFIPIGTTKTPYSGAFDGNFHTISNLNVDIEGAAFVGFVGTAGSDMSMKDITFDSTCSFRGDQYVAPIGGSLSAQTGHIYVTNVGNEGTVYAETSNAGGVIGHNQSSSATWHIKHCFSTGKVESEQYAAAIASWTGNKGLGEIVDCWSSAEIINPVSAERYVYRYGGTAPAASKIYATGGNQGTIVAASTVATGELTWILNGSTFLNATWFQTLGADDHPVSDNTHGLIYQNVDGGFESAGTSEADFANLRQNTLDLMRREAETAIAYQGAINDVLDAVNVLYQVKERDAFVQAYAAKVPLITALRTSKTAYQSYIDAVDYAANLLKENNVSGEDADRLMDYIQNADEPSELYPNGAYLYIIEQKQLTNAEIAKEKNFVNEMLATALWNGYKAGTEITILMKNPKFEEAFSTGWQGAYATGKQAFNLSNGLFIGAESWSATPFDMHQTLTGLKDGIYLLEMNAAERPSNDYNSQLLNYTASIYLNDDENYIMTAKEAAIAVEDAVDGVNANLTGETADIPLFDEMEEAIAYMPHGVRSVALMANGGRAKNYIVTNVTDGSLTVGIRNRHSHQGNDWTGFANTKLTYLGTMDDATATDGIDLALNGQLARANTILNDYEPGTFSDDYMLMPNFSEAQKTELAELVEQAAEATDNSAKYEVVKKLSALFANIYSCKQAYVKMHKTGDELTDVYGILATPAEQAAIQNTIDMAMDAYTYGTASEEDANDIIELMQADPYYIRKYGNAALLSLMSNATALSSSAKDFKGLITSASQFSSNCQWESGGSLANLLDSNMKTHFHSATSMNISSGEEYIQVDFGKPVSTFYLEFAGRSDGA